MFVCLCRPSVLWRCWLGGRKGIRPVKNWVVGCWHSYLSGARCRLAYGPADTTATHCLLLSRLVLPFWYRLTRVVPGKGPLNGCVCVSWQRGEMRWRTVRSRSSEWWCLRGRCSRAWWRTWRCRARRVARTCRTLAGCCWTAGQRTTNHTAGTSPAPPTERRYDQCPDPVHTIRYDTRCSFNVQFKSSSIQQFPWQGNPELSYHIRNL